MKPFSHFADLAPIKPNAIKAKPCLIQAWVKVDGKLECRWIEERR